MAKHISSADKITAFLTIPFFLLLGRLINRDFWYDEIYTLANYVFVPLDKTVLVFRDFNNHFLFSLFCKSWLAIVAPGKDLFWLMDRPYIIRAPLLIFPAVTIYYLYRIGTEFFNRRVAVLSIVLLITTIPYYYYAIQLRGYSMSIMLITIILYNYLRKYR